MTPNTGHRRPTLAECTAAANARLARFAPNPTAQVFIRRAERLREFDRESAAMRRRLETANRGRIIAGIGK